jgi:RNA polymerase sigma factor for flagellar operon FliA
MISTAHADRDRDQLIVDHLHLPKFLALRITSTLDRSACLDDLMGYGHLGLVQAADRFRPGQGLEFGTFAWPRIQGAIVDGIRATGRYKRPDVERYRKAAAASDTPPPPMRLDVALRPDFIDNKALKADDELDRRRVRARIPAAIAALPDTEREIAEMHYLRGLDFVQIGARLGVSRSYVCRVHGYAVRLLAEALHGDVRRIRSLRKAA